MFVVLVSEATAERLSLPYGFLWRKSKADYDDDYDNDNENCWIVVDPIEIEIEIGIGIEGFSLLPSFPGLTRESRRPLRELQPNFLDSRGHEVLF